MARKIQSGEMVLVGTSVIESMCVIVDYDWSVEFDNYEEFVRDGEINEEDGGSGHVFEHLQAVDAWLRSHGA